MTDRQKMLMKLAAEYIESHTGYLGIDDNVEYEGIMQDGFALAEDLKDEVNNG